MQLHSLNGKRNNGTGVDDIRDIQTAVGQRFSLPYKRIALGMTASLLQKSAYRSYGYRT